MPTHPEIPNSIKHIANATSSTRKVAMYVYTKRYGRYQILLCRKCYQGERNAAGETRRGSIISRYIGAAGTSMQFWGKWCN